MPIVGVIIVVLLLIPNIFYAIKNKNTENTENKESKCKNKVLNGLEQLGRYGAMILMFLPIGIPEFGFWSKNGFVIWLIAIPVLLLLYWIIWTLYLLNARYPAFFQLLKVSRNVLALLLAIIPGIIFIMHGICLAHWLLVIMGVVFAVTHIWVTYKNLVAV